MAAVTVTSVAVLNNPGLFTQPMQFEIQYECLTALAHGKTRFLAQLRARFLSCCTERQGSCVRCISLQIKHRRAGNEFCMRVCVISNSTLPFKDLSARCNLLRHADLEWKLTYVGSADSEEYDQVLDSVMLGPIVPGQYKFVLQVSC